MSKLKSVSYLCFGCRETHTVRMAIAEVPRRTVTKTCPRCNKYRRHHIAGPRPITRRDVL
jgi:hypothetical protein